MVKQNNRNDLNCNETRRKVCIIGLDGATFDVIEPLIKNGDLPNIASIMKGGVSAELNSTFFPQSAAAWTSFATGKNPGKHSIIGFSKMTSDNYKLELVCGSGNKAKTIWEVLSEKKKKVIVIGIPMTYPPKPVNGILISGMDAPTVNASSVYPPQMAEGILKISPDYKTRLYLKGYLHNDKKRIKALNLITNSINATAKLVHHLMNNNQWDFFVVRFSSPDNVQHHYWSYFDKNHSKHNPKSPFILKDAINSIYRQLDRIIGELYKNINKDDTTFIIMSDHGAGPLADRAVFLNEWLRKMGYLCEIKNNRDRSLIKFLWKSGLFSFLVKIIPPDIKRVMIKRFPPLIQKTAMYLKFPNIDWSKTKAFVSEVDGIRINKNGKYPQGIVTKEDYEDIRDSIINGLKYIRDSGILSKFQGKIETKSPYFS